MNTDLYNHATPAVAFPMNAVGKGRSEGRDPSLTTEAKLPRLPHPLPSRFLPSFEVQNAVPGAAVKTTRHRGKSKRC